MTAPKDTPNNLTPKADLDTASSEKVPLDGCAITCLFIIFTTGVVFVVAAIGFFWVLLPPWAAVLLGLLAGGIALAFCFVEESTLLEVAVKCLIHLVLISILIPVFYNARQKAQQKAKSQMMQMQKR